FDSLNPLIVRGLAVQQIRGFVVESLMARGNGEAFTLYGLLAKSVETDDTRSYVTFHLDPRARFSDGQPVLAEDVLFSWALLRDPDYWGRELPVNRGLWNFDEVRLDFYREANGQFEAFKRGLYDFRVESEPLRWHDGYDFPAVRNGEVIRDTIKTGMPQPSEFLVFNTRRPVFSDIRVRQALTLLFDF